MSPATSTRLHFLNEDAEITLRWHSRRTFSKHVEWKWKWKWKDKRIKKHARLTLKAFTTNNKFQIWFHFDRRDNAYRGPCDLDPPSCNTSGCHRQYRQQYDVEDNDEKDDDPSDGNNCYPLLVDNDVDHNSEDDDDNTYIMMKCVFVCNEKSSLPPGSLL